MTTKYQRTLVTVLSLLSLLIATASQAVPWWAPTGLPLEGMFDKSKEDQQAAEKIVTGLLRMQFYQDTTERDLYYLVPVYHAVNNTVAGTALINYKHLDRLQAMMNISEKIQKELRGSLEEIKKIETIIRTEASKEHPNLEFIARLKLHRDEEQTRMETGKGLVPYADALASLLAFSRVVPQPEESLINPMVRNRYLSQAAEAVAGQLTVNITAQLDHEDQATLSQYMHLRAQKGLPLVRLQVMPLMNQTFTALREAASGDETAAQRGIPLIPSIVGKGGFKAATLDVSLSGDAASAFGAAPIPMILPVAVVAKSLVEFPPFEASLKCDFSVGDTLRYASQVTDGAMWNDLIDETSTVTQVTANTKPCLLDTKGGGGDEKKTASFQTALLKIQEELVKNVLAEANASAAEMQRLQAELRSTTKDHTRAGKQGNNESIVEWYIHSTHVKGHEIKGPHKGRHLMIHTNNTMVNRMRNLKIDMQINDKTYAQVPIDVPAQICLAYYPTGKHYVACGKVDVEGAGGILDAKKAALESPLCEGKTVEECRKIRENEAPRSDAGSIIHNFPKENK